MGNIEKISINKVQFLKNPEQFDGNFDQIIAIFPERVFEVFDDEGIIMPERLEKIKNTNEHAASSWENLQADCQAISNLSTLSHTYAIRNIIIGMRGTEANNSFREIENPAVNFIEHSSFAASVYNLRLIIGSLFRRAEKGWEEPGEGIHKLYEDANKIYTKHTMNLGAELNSWAAERVD